MSITSQWPLPPNGIRFIVPEFMQDFFTTNALTKDCYPLAFGYYPLAKYHKMQRNDHIDNLMIYCVHGEGKLGYEGTNRAILPGDLMILPKNQVHTYCSDINNPWTIYWIHFDGELAENFLSNIGHQSTAFSIGRQTKLIADFDALMDIRQTGYNQKQFIHMANLLRQIFTYIAAIYPNTLIPKGSNFDLEAVHALMQEKLHEQLDLDTLAKQVNVSKYHFSAKYKSLTGQSPIQHFIHLKMEHACHLLDSSNASIKSISQSLGYDDSYYFSRLFKKIIGLSPKKYRQLNKG